MRVVTGNKYPDNRWIVVDDNDEVIFDPAYEISISKTLKLCTVYVGSPEHRGELHEKFGRRTDYGWDNDSN